MLFMVFLIFLWGSSGVMGVAVLTADEESNLDGYIKSFINCKGVPGVGLAIVKDGSVFARGYGLSDIENQINATESTIFCLGSVTKSMTAMLLARLMSTGEHDRFTWLTKIKDIFGPEYKFLDDCMTDSVSLTDILSHRTGLVSADLLLQAGVPASVTREKLMKNLHYLPKVLEFRETFFYNNLVYVLSGHVAEKLTNKSWEELMKEELFAPLNMTSTVLIDDDNIPTIAVPYIADYSGKLHISDERLYRLYPFGPSGSICSSSNDMTKWLKLITSGGKTDDGLQLITENIMMKQFLPKSTLDDLWRHAYSLQPPFPVFFDTYGYSFGWFTSYYRGHKLLHHSGSFYGYSCKIAFLPDINCAFVFSTNGPGEAKFDEAMNPIFYYVLDTVLGYSSWLNETTSCSYPSPWNEHRLGRSIASNNVDADEESIETDMHSGVYNHPLYGKLTLTRINGTIHLSYGVIMKGTLTPTRSSFLVELDEPLKSVFLSFIIVSFSNISTDKKYTNVEMVAHFESYTFTRIEFEQETSNSVVFHIQWCYLIVIMAFLNL